MFANISQISFIRVKWVRTIFDKENGTAHKVYLNSTISPKWAIIEDSEPRLIQAVIS